MGTSAATTPIRVLVVDDEPGIRRALRTALGEMGFVTTEASRGEEAIQLLQSNTFDIVLLDVNMPGMGGIKALMRLRDMAPRLPILMLTVVDGEEEKINALECGADDYITKPFSIREVIARMRSAVRRSQAPERKHDAPLVVGDIEVQPTKRVVTKRGQPIHLTRKEYDILHYLMTHSGRAVTYGKLLASVWGVEYRNEVDYLRTFVRQLRKKIEDDPSAPKYLLTDAYVGYRFAELPQGGEAGSDPGEAVH